MTARARSPPGAAGSDFSTTYVSDANRRLYRELGRLFHLVRQGGCTGSGHGSVCAHSEPDTETIRITPTDLAAPIIDPPSGAKAVDLPVSIALPTGPLPTGARSFYTTDGTDPGNLNGNPTGGTLYEGQFNSGAGADGGGGRDRPGLSARVLTHDGSLPATRWQTPMRPSRSPPARSSAAPHLNGTFVGSLVCRFSLAGGSNMSDITFNGNAKILKGEPLSSRHPRR